jgi:hypothetical protein
MLAFLLLDQKGLPTPKYARHHLAKSAHLFQNETSVDTSLVGAQALQSPSLAWMIHHQWKTTQHKGYQPAHLTSAFPASAPIST